MSPARILVAGIGNIFLGDDGFGSEVISRGLRPSSLDIGANSGLPVSTVLV